MPLWEFDAVFPREKPPRGEHQFHSMKANNFPLKVNNFYCRVKNYTEIQKRNTGWRDG
jgi:hypothetical protein